MSLYLSRLLLNARSRQVWSELASPYEMHRTLMHAFEGYLADSKERGREKVGMLFRAEADEQEHHVVVYVQSLVEPDWSFLEHLKGYVLDTPDRSGVSVKDVSGAYATLQDGQTLSFRLRANPTRRIGNSAVNKPELKGKRVGLLSEESQVAWLARKGRAGGFDLLPVGMAAAPDGAQPPLSVTVRLEGKQVGRKREAQQLHAMTHLAVVFDGLLRVTDAGVFRKSLVAGIGSGKAYGFGLLSIARASRR